MISNISFFSGSDVFPVERTLTYEAIDHAAEELLLETHAKEREKSRGLPRAIYANPCLAEAKRRGIVISDLKAPLRYRLEAMKMHWRGIVSKEISRIRWRIEDFTEVILEKWHARP